MERRSFLKMSAALSASAAVTGCDSSSSDVNVVDPDIENPDSTTEQVNWSSCTCNCAAACSLKVISEDNIVTRIETDDTTDDTFGNHQSRACLRGRSSRQKIYALDRLKYPMKRVGKRGAGDFVRISWEEAYSTIASELKRIVDTYGNKSVYWQYASGTNQFRTGGRESSKRLLNLMGGFLNQHGTYSAAQLAAITPYSLGWTFPSSSYNQMQHSDLIVAFGWNPTETRMSGTGGAYDMSLFAAGKEVIVIDPRYSETAAANNVTWLPVRPGTDAALIEGVAHYLITNNLADEAFLNKYCVGYDASTLPASAPANGDYKSYILGNGDDGIVKTPAWAAAICGLSEVKIIDFALKLSKASAPFIAQGYGPQRQANGEQATRAICTLPMLIGKIGSAGMNTGMWPGQSSTSLGVLPIGTNAVKEVIPCFMWTEAIINGENMTSVEHGIQGADELGANMKFIWNYAGNTLINQHADCFETAKILEDDTLCEFILVHDVQYTPSAKFADILLPDVMDLEQHDIIQNAATDMLTITAMTSSVKPLADVKSCFEVCKNIATKLGLENEFTEGRTYEEWVEYVYETSRGKNAELLPYAEMVKKGVHKISQPGTSIGAKSFIDDPVANPLSTPSGKFEIYSEQLAEIAATWTLPADGKDLISALPQYYVTWEGYEDTDTATDYPLQMIGHHTKGRTHSSFHNIPWLREAVEDAVWMNPLDASQRGLSNGDAVKIYNDRGTIISKVKVTPRIMPGVCSLAQGAWFAPEGSVDVGGCVNTITSHRPSSFAKGNPQHTNRVQVVKA
ncbi:DMSO/selenate family reductase complex A subunit [Shewanella indica]|uniref:DMSO/selenate family reductase complex A subunit n=1 Tax=Shewanella indica TaxID=768528 RepID=UPI003D36E912